MTTSLAPDDPIYVWASDVSYRDLGGALALAASAFQQPEIGTYAPSAWFSGHPQMWNQRRNGVRRTLFVEGFCFASRARVLRQLCPIDLERNALGWGVDIQLGYVTRQCGLYTVVDDRLKVDHPRSTGYSTAAAPIQRHRWVAGMPPSARRFHRVATWEFTKHRPLNRLLATLPW